MKLTDELKSAIRGEGEAAYPNECCGVILGEIAGRGDCTAVRLSPVPNVRESGETWHRYEIAPADFLKAEREARGEGLDVVGIYHSHPDHPAVPSEFDLKTALPWYFYVIVSVENGRAAELTNWKLADDGNSFVRVVET
jgi:proteasome lid subunit RPN8/RPN11